MYKAFCAEMMLCRATSACSHTNTNTRRVVVVVVAGVIVAVGITLVAALHSRFVGCPTTTMRMSMYAHVCWQEPGVVSLFNDCTASFFVCLCLLRLVVGFVCWLFFAGLFRFWYRDGANNLPDDADERARRRVVSAHRTINSMCNNITLNWPFDGVGAYVVAICLCIHISWHGIVAHVDHHYQHHQQQQQKQQRCFPPHTSLAC